MSEIKRYKVLEQGGSLVTAKRIDGMKAECCKETVLIKEKQHLAAIQQAKIDAVREFVEWCNSNSMTNPYLCVESESKRYIEQLKEQEHE